ncbi:MAG TPA: hypothetical protein VHQ41_03305 [Patescibacteria group bacterium]|jgi:hypothetical protein|nr:hypothetical protein [Patescibacteria group bacterium]
MGTSELEKLIALDQEYQAYIADVKRKWLADNKPRSNNVLEVMSPNERAAVDNCIAQWARYIRPLTEEWWNTRGYGVRWPEDKSKPLQIYKLEIL